MIAAGNEVSEKISVSMRTSHPKTKAISLKKLKLAYCLLLIESLLDHSVDRKFSILIDVLEQKNNQLTVDHQRLKLGNNKLSRRIKDHLQNQNFGFD